MCEKLVALRPVAVGRRKYLFASSRTLATNGPLRSTC
jgi:hypothetical protein